jgi:hypothetical protein
MSKKADREGSDWPNPAPEIVRLICSLAIADARRDHEEAMRQAADKAKAKQETGCDADDQEPGTG